MNVVANALAAKGQAHLRSSALDGPSAARNDPKMGQGVAQKAQPLDEAVAALSPAAFGFLERLVAEPSVLGREAGAQELVALELERLGFRVERIPVPEEIGGRPGAGRPLVPYGGRDVVAGRRGGAAGPTLLINGHVNMIPAGEEALWSTPAFEPVRRDGWLVGRGAGDMKSGFAMALLALEAALETDPAVREAPLAFVSVIEEECTGNGTLAAAHAGFAADEVVIPECTGLELLLDGIGILWAEIEVPGRAAHAHLPGAGVNAVEAALPVLAALKELEDELNDGSSARCATTVGTFHAGDWRSSIPALARVGVRVGFPLGMTPGEAEERVVAAIDRAARRDPWLSEAPPRVTFEGFRAEPYTLARDHELVTALSSAHADVFGSSPRIWAGTATTDARVYLNQFGVPALCYGPRARDIHGVDEAVELQSVVDGARVLARFLCARAERSR